MIYILLLLLKLSYAVNDWRTAIYFEPIRNSSYYSQLTTHNYWRLHICISPQKTKIEPFNSTFAKLYHYNDEQCNSIVNTEFKEGYFYDEVEINNKVLKTYYYEEGYTDLDCTGKLFIYTIFDEPHCNKDLIKDSNNNFVLYTKYMDYSHKYIYTNWNIEPSADDICKNENLALINAVSQKIGECNWQLNATTQSWVFYVNHKNFPEYQECDSSISIGIFSLFLLCAFIF